MNEAEANKKLNKKINKKWDTRSIIEETIRSMGGHNQPAPQTLAMLNEVKTTLAVQAEKHLEIDKTLKDIKETGEQTLAQALKTNGRVNKLDDWSNNTKVLIENILKDNKATNTDYTINKTRLWTAVTLLVFFGGTIIALSVNAIDAKIERGIKQALANNVAKVEYEK